MKTSKLLSMSEAADLLKLEHRANVSQWMRRRLRRVEAQKSVRLLYRDGREWKVPAHKLRLAYPENFEPAELAAKDTRKSHKKMLAVMTSMDDRLDDIEANLALLAETYRKLISEWKAR
jgi:hypothetical protein